MSSLNERERHDGDFWFWFGLAFSCFFWLGRVSAFDAYLAFIARGVIAPMGVDYSVRPSWSGNGVLLASADDEYQYDCTLRFFELGT